MIRRLSLIAPLEAHDHSLGVKAGALAGVLLGASGLVLASFIEELADVHGWCLGEIVLHLHRSHNRKVMLRAVQRTRP